VARSTGRGVDDNFVFAAAGAINAIARAQVVERAVMAVAGRRLGTYIPQVRRTIWNEFSVQFYA
jgi:hypothetical protein